MDSDETPEQPSRSRREHVGGVLGIAGALVVILALVFGLVAVRGGAVDGAEPLAEILGDPPYPLGLELVEAARLPTRELVIRLETTREGPAAGPESAPPREVVFVLFPQPEAALRVFRGPEEGGDGGFEGGGRGGGGEERGGGSREASANMMRWEKNPDFAWHTPIESDEIAWSRWTADYRIERSFREGGGWADSVRVNLSQKGRNLVMFAQWPDETEVSKDVLRTLLREIEMLDVET